MPQLLRSRSIVLLIIAAGILFTHLGTARLWDRDEPRNSRASHEMLARGDWIVPTFNGELRDHKPILLYWGQMIGYLSLGESEFTARLPSALCGLFTVLAVAVLASRLSGVPKGISRDGFWAGAALATCLLFVMAGRAATPDACLMAFSTLGIASLVVASLESWAPFSSGRVGKAKWIWAAWGYTMLGFAALAKGPVGIVLPLAVVHTWWMICARLQQMDSGELREPRSLTARLLGLLRESWLTFNPLQLFRSVWALRTIPGVLLTLAVAAPWYVAVGLETDGAFLRGFFLEHNLGRAVSSMEGHSGSLLFYPVALLVGTFPWSLWLLPIAIWSRHVARTSVAYRQLVVLATVWIGIYVVAFTMASTKLPSYITPCYAGAALAIGGYLRQFEGKWFLPAIHWRRTAAGLAIALGAAISVGILVLSRWEAMPALQWIGLSGIALTLAGVACLIWERMERVEWVPATWLCAAVAFQIILFGFGTSIVDRYRGDLQLLANVQKGSSVERDWISIGGLEPSWVMYLGKQVEDIKESQLTEKSWQQLDRFWERKPDGNLIVVGASMLAQVQERYGEGLLEPIASGNRFLKSGQVHVLRLHSAEAFQAYLQHRSATHSLLR